MDWQSGTLDMTSSAIGLPEKHTPLAWRRDSLEEGDDGFCEDVIPVTGDHMGGVCHVDILSVRALGEETLRPCLT
jgi:hypothetical protein